MIERRHCHRLLLLGRGERARKLRESGCALRARPAREGERKEQAGLAVGRAEGDREERNQAFGLKRMRGGREESFRFFFSEFSKSCSNAVLN